MYKTTTLGTIRNLSSKYIKIRQLALELANKKINLNDSGSPIHDKGNVRLISGKEGKINEMSTFQLPPLYVEKFDMLNDILKELQIKFTKLQEDQQKRIMPKFDDKENRRIDKLIRDNITEMTSKIKQCEENIQFIAKEKTENSVEQTIKDNMKQNLIAKLGEFTKKLKKNEEEYMSKYKELVGDEVKYTDSKGSFDDSNRKNSNFLKVDNTSEILVKRDTEITNLLTSINELAQIFKDLQVLVVEQGTILDRIDYNIESALCNTKQAHKDLVKAEASMKKNCARNTNLALIVFIFICSILLIIKLS